MNRPKIGDWVRIERDETRYPSKGTWPRYRGKVGMIVALHRPEFGVSWAPYEDIARTNADSWFLIHELRVLSNPPRRHRDTLDSRQVNS